jgi:transcriptional regulator with XRE-family HTH domain
MTQEELAEKAGTTAALLSKYETGSSLPSTPKLLAALDALGSDFGALEWTARSMIFDDARRAIERQGPPGRPELLQAQAALHLAGIFGHLAELFRLWTGEPYHALMTSLGQNMPGGPRKPHDEPAAGES